MTSLAFLLQERNNVTEDKVRAVLDWKVQAAAFESDGSLRDIYIHKTTTEDWQRVLSRILDGDYRAQLRCGDESLPLPAHLDSIFGAEDESGRFNLSFQIEDVVLTCHFFHPIEIEFSFEPSSVTETSLQALLRFLVDIADATLKPAIMTPENSPEVPFFSYDPSAHEPRWISPARGPALQA